MKLHRAFILTVVLLLLLGVAGCAPGTEDFKAVFPPIAGTWFIVEDLVYSDNTTLHREYEYLFSGNNVEGNVRTSLRTGGIFGGRYAVSGDNILFNSYYGRGLWWSQSFYTGRLNLQNGTISGELTGRIILVGQNDLANWSGTFFARKMDGRDQPFSPLGPVIRDGETSPVN